MPKTVPNAFTRTNFAEQNLRGFTLVELLVVIAIMALMGAYTLSNYGSFGEDQKLKNAVLDVVSLLRQAQINTTTGVKCRGWSENGWIVQIGSGYLNLDLMCKYPGGMLLVPVKNLFIPEKYGSTISISSVTAGSTDCSAVGNVIISFIPPSGAMRSNCSGTDPIKITFKNSKISLNCTDANLAKCKSLIIESGGRIYAD